MSAEPGKGGRLLQLDFLRGIAILLVLHFHGVLKASSAGILSPLTTRLNRMGWTGVDLFFVLSGFLIGGLLFQEIKARGGLDVRRFLVRRAFKIWPSYYLFLAYLAVMIPLTDLVDETRATRSLLPNLLHVQNYVMPPRGHTWSLAVEEHFYLALPFLLVLLLRSGRGLKWIPWIGAGLGLLCLTLRLIASHAAPFAQVTHYFPTQLRIDSLFFGVVLAYFWHVEPEKLRRLLRYRPALLVAGLLLVLPATLPRFDIHIGGMAVFGFAGLALGYGCLLLCVVSTPLGVGLAGRLLASLPARVIAFIGTYSYPIYLWHIDCGKLPLRYLANHGFLAGARGEVRWIVYMALYIGAATLVGFVLGKLVEKPALALRDRLFPSRTAGSPAQASP